MQVTPDSLRRAQPLLGTFVDITTSGAAEQVRSLCSAATTSASRPIGRVTRLRLEPSVRWTVYSVVAALFVSGAAWLMADALKDDPGSDAWQLLAANLLMVHGGAAMVMLIVFGALFPVHIRRAWRVRKNRLSGSAMVTLNGLLILTAFGLYYAGSELIRPWISGAHIAAGFALAFLTVLHILLGRKSLKGRPASPARNECGHRKSAKAEPRASVA